MRTLEGHKVNEANEKLEVLVVDEKGQGGACHHYVIEGYDAHDNPSMTSGIYNRSQTDILFQNGPIKEAGVNGVTHEALLAILIDRMECFQEGDYACDYNALALDALKAAQNTLFARTKERMARNVEGTHEQ